jgi:hypothetical protein
MRSNKKLILQTISYYWKVWVWVGDRVSLENLCPKKRKNDKVGFKVNFRVICSAKGIGIRSGSASAIADPTNKGHTDFTGNTGLIASASPTTTSATDSTAATNSSGVTDSIAVTVAETILNTITNSNGLANSTGAIAP